MKPVLTLAIMALCASMAWAQPDYQVGKMYEGYILLDDNTREEGFVVFEDPVKRSQRVVFYKNANDRRSKKIYKPKKLNGYGVGSMQFKTLTYRNILKSTAFAELTQGGQISVYSVCSAYDATKGEYQCEMILQKGQDEPVVSTKFLRFADNMSDYVSDYEALATKIRNKEKGYRLLGMMNIIAEYNQWYADNH